jgi:hypothetical protein
MTDPEPKDPAETASLLRDLALASEWVADLIRRSLPRRPSGESGGDWSAGEVFTHIRASDAIAAPRIIQVVLRPDVPMMAFDEREWARHILLAEIPLEDQITAFRVGRLELVAMLHSLRDDQWAMSGVHEEFGARSIAQMVQAIVDHEAEHRRQLAALAGPSQ